MQPLGQRYHPPKAIMVEALTSWAAHEQDEAGASFARHRENVCALGLGKNMEIEELTKKVKALEAFSAAEEKRGIDLRERTRKCGQMILATGEVVALPRRAGEAVGLAERVSAWRAKLESGQMGVLILQQAMLRDLFRQCPDEEEAINDAIRRYEEDLRGRFGPILVDQVEDIAESLREVDARERLGVFDEKWNAVVQTAASDRLKFMWALRGGEELDRDQGGAPLMQPESLPEDFDDLYEAATDEAPALLQAMRTLVQSAEGKLSIAPRLHEPFSLKDPDLTSPESVIHTQEGGISQSMKSRSRARSECNGEPRLLLDLVSGRGEIDQSAAADCLSAKAFERAGLQLARVQLAGTFLEIVVSRRDGPGILGTLELTTGGLTKAYRAKRKYAAEYRREKDEAEYKDQQSLDKDDLYNPDAKKRIVKIQHDIAETMAGCTRGTYAADAAKIRVDELLADAIDQISQENERIESLTQARRSYYSAASARWELLRRIEFRTTQRAVQPIGWGGRASEAATFLGDRRTRYLRLARDHARELMAYFRSTLEDLVERVNDCETVEGLRINWKKLEESSHRMDFDQRRLLAGETSRLEKARLRFTCGPLKSLGRAAVKAEEYEDEIHDSHKAHVGEDGRRLLGCDYVLDWLRGTVVSEDPYNLYVFFLLLRSEEDRGIGARFHIQRVKNKFFDERYPNLIRTNALINLLLLYPADAKAFKKSGIRGKWDAKFAGEPCASVEVQLTLNDYLTIKNLMHTYYDVMRAEDPRSFLIENPIFVDADTLAPAEDEKDLAAASARVERLELELAAAREHEKGLVEARMAELERMIAGSSADQLPRGSGRGAAASLQRSKTAPVLRERAASGGAGDVAAAPVTPPQEGASSPERVATPRTHVPSPEPEATPVPRDDYVAESFQMSIEPY